MRSARLLLAVAVSVGILVTGCADGDVPKSAGPTDAETPVAGAPVAGTTTAAATAGGSTPVSAEDLCGYLRGQLPTLRAIGSTVGAEVLTLAGMDSFATL